MAKKPDVVNLEANSTDVLNAIRTEASESYQNQIPRALADGSNLREIGEIMMTFQPLQNEFLSALVNRIGRVILTSKLYDNPWSMFKKGMLEYGETVEEIFVNIAKPFTFNPEQAERTVWKREIPDVRAAFHTMNYQKYYKSTVSNDQLRTAFLSSSGITDLIAKIIDSMYTAANYDEFQVMKYMLAKAILKGNISTTTIPDIETANMDEIVAIVKGFSNNMTFMATDRNMAGVATYTDKKDQFVIINANFEAAMNVNVLASAFNMEKAEFMGHMVMIDGFGKLDLARLNQLFGSDAGYTPISSANLEELDKIPLAIVSRDFFMVFDNFFNFTELYNGEGLYWNYWYHTWKTFSISPFAEAQIFAPSASTVTGVTVTPSTATAVKGTSLQLSASVTGTGFVSQKVNWSSNEDSISVTTGGLVRIPSDFTGTTVTITATSQQDSTKSASCTITIS